MKNEAERLKMYSLGRAAAWLGCSAAELKALVKCGRADAYNLGSSACPRYYFSAGQLARLRPQEGSETVQPKRF